jgi:hypothetical protein
VPSQDALQSIIRDKDDVWYRVISPISHGKKKGVIFLDKGEDGQIYRMSFKIDHRKSGE